MSRKPSVVRELAHEPGALQLPVRADAGDACQGGIVKDPTLCLPQSVPAGTDEPMRLKQEIARISATLVAINDLALIGSAGAAHKEELGTRLVELRQRLSHDQSVTMLQTRVSTQAAMVENAEKELQQRKVDFQTSKEELEQLLKERRSVGSR